MPRSILIVYGLMQHPLRSTVEDHLYALRHYSRARCFYVNAMLGPVPRWIRRIEHDAIVFHTTLLSAMRWAPALGEMLRSRALALRDAPAVRVAMPQDEFLRSDELCGFIRDCKVDVVFSVAPPSQWPTIYSKVDRKRVRFEQVLTGYLDERTLRRIETILQETDRRTTDLCYRAGAERPYLGRHGLLKTEIAGAAQPLARARRLSTDISLRPEDTLVGDDWFRHLAASRWTLGVEGGASILDRDGSLRERTESYLAEHPQADFDTIEAACFPGRDGEISLFALSPRHLEACATRTGQILVEGEYSGVLEAGRHYLPLRPDLSNLGEILDASADERRRLAMTDAAYRDVVASGSYTYRGLVERLDSLLLAAAPRTRHPFAHAALAGAERAARARERLSWLRVRYRLRWRPRWRMPLGRGVAFVRHLRPLR